MKLTDITLADVSVETKVETLGVVLDKKLSEIDAQVSTVTKLVGPQGPKGEKGDKGAVGLQGIAGKDGKDGLNGKNGKDGKDGDDGKAGVSVVGASVALDGSLVLDLSNGGQIDAGEVVGPAGPGGMNGNQGPQGLQGPQGIQGATGSAGATGATGATGPQGEQGIQGIQGVAGPTGPQGIQGVKGDTGDTGATGAPGTSVNIKGEVATVGALPSVGNVVGDAYIVTADGNLYTWTGSSWLDVGQIVGPQGATGATGPQGIQGVKGDTGDTGPQGIQGIQGIQGVKGDTGDTGPAGTNGTNGVGVPVGGTTGQVLSKINATDYNTQWITPNAGTVTSVTGTAPVVSSGGATPAISMAQATSLVSGYLSSTDWSTFNGKQPAGTYATGTGTASGTNTGDETTATIKTKLGVASTSTDGYLTSTDWNTFNGKSNTVGTVTSVAALTLGTTGTDLSSTVATGTTTPVITLQVPTASAANRGALSSADWSTFNGKQAALVSGTNIKTINGSSVLGSGDLVVGGSFTGGTLTSKLTLAAGTATAGTAPLHYQTGVLNTTAEAGTVEYDGNTFYSSVAASTRGVVPSEQMVVLTSNNTLTSQTAAQPIFDGGGGPAGGAVTLPIGTYVYEASYCIASMSATSGSHGFNLGGTATKTFSFNAHASKAGTSLTTPQAVVATCGTGAITTLVANSTGTVGQAVIKGIIRVTVAGTVIPQISLTQAAAAVIQANSHFKVSRIGNATVTTVGNWA